MISSGNVNPFPFPGAQKSNEIDGISGRVSEIGEIQMDFTDFDAIPVPTIYRAWSPLWLESAGARDFVEFRVILHGFRGIPRRRPKRSMLPLTCVRPGPGIHENPRKFAEF